MGWSYHDKVKFLQNTEGLSLLKIACDGKLWGKQASYGWISIVESFWLMFPDTCDIMLSWTVL